MIGTALTEDDAFQLLRGWSVVPEEKKPLARAKLEAYRDERAANGEPLWPGRQAARERVEVERMEKLWLADPTTDKPDSMMVRQIDFLSTVTKRPPHQVAVEPHRYRRAVAGYLGDEAAAESPEAFDALARGFVQKQRERRLLLSGNGNPEDVSNGGALEVFAADAARYNRPATEAWAEWSRQSSVKPGFADAMTEGEGLFSHFQRVHEKARRQWEGFGERADGILRELEARTNDGSPTLETTAALPFLDGLTPPQRDAVLSLVVERAKAKDKGLGQQTGEAVGRVFARLAEAQTDSVSRVALSAGSFREGQTVPAALASDPAGLVRRQVSRTQATVGAGMFGDVSGMAGAVDGAFAPTAALTKEQADAANKEIARQREAVAVEARLRDVATGAVDAVKGSNWFTDHVYYPALNVAGSIGSFAAPGGWAANLAAYVEDEQSRLEAAGVSPEAVMVQAPLVGGVQAAMDRLQLGLLRKLPALSGVAERLTAPAVTGFGAVAQRLPGALATAVGESGVESAQQAFPLVTQKVFDALGADEPDVSWDAVAKETWAAAPDTFFGMLPLVMLGAGVGSARDYKNVRSLVGDASALREVGFDDAQISRITKAGDAEAMVRALKAEWGGRTPVIGPAASPTEQAALDVVRDPLAPAGEVAVAAKSRAKIETTRRVLTEIQQAAGVKSVRRTAGGWTMENEDGTVTVGTPEEVRSAMIGMGRARSEKEAGAMMSLIDYFAAQDAAEDVGSVTSVNAAAQVARMGADGKPEAVSVRTKADGTVDVETLAWKPETLANLAAEMRAAGVSEASILGMNSALADDSGRLARAYQTNAGADIRTILHERFERLYREGRVDEVGVIEAANILAALPQFDPARMRDPSQRKVAESLRRIALEDESVTAAEKRETLVDLVVADVLGRWQDGTKLPAGAIEAGILEASMVGMTEEQEAAMGTFRGVWRAVKAYLKGMFGIASRIAQARRKGQLKEGDGWTDFVDKLLGVDAEKAHVEAVAEEVDAGASFSLGDTTAADARHAELEARAKTGDAKATAEAQAMVDAAAKAAGYNVGPVYHGAPQKFVVFDSSRIGQSNGRGEGPGFYFTDSKSVAEGYARNDGLFTVMLRMKNPLDYNAKPFTRTKLRKLIKAVAVEEARSNGDEITDGFLANFGDTYGKSIDRVVDDAASTMLEDSAIDQIGGLVGAGVSAADVLAGLRDSLGFDGFVSKGFRGQGAEDAPTIFVVGSPNQIKSADPFTYDDAGNLIPLSQRFDPTRDEITFSLGSVNTLEAIAARLEERVALGGAVAKLEAYQNIARNLEGMARAARANEDTETILSLNKIEAQRRALRKKLEDEYILDFYATSSVAGAMTSEAATTITANPLLSKLLVSNRPPKGRFMPLAKSLKQGGTGDVYEYGVQLGMPAWLFRGDMTPDKVAEELGMEVDEMWEAIARELESVAGAAADLRKAQANVQEAKQRAREEARAWASSERARMAASDKRDESRTLITLDAILAQLPAEVRGRVGGFTKLSQLKANDVRRKHFLEMIGKIDVEMERYLRRSYLTTIRELFTKSKPRRMAGEKDRGRLGVNAHAWIEKAEEVSKWDETKLEEREDYIEKRLAGAEKIGEQAISDLNRAWDFGEGEDAARMALEQESAILDLFGGLSHYKDGVPVKGSGEMEAALMALRATIETGRLVRESELMRRRADRETRRLQLQSDSGNTGSDADKQAREEELQGLRGILVNELITGFSFEQFIGDLFGRGSNTHRFAEDTVMEAELSERAMYHQAQSELSAFLRTLWPRTGRLGRLRNQEALSVQRPIPGAPADSPKMSQMEAVHMTMLWSDMDSRDWLKMYGFGEDMQTALEAYLTPEAKAVRTWLQEWYDDQYDDLNEVYRRIHGTNMPRVRNYSPRMVEHGKDAVSIDPLGMGGLSARGVFAGFTKRRRPTLTAAPLLVDALQAWAQNQRVVTHFLSWAEASSELRAVFSTSSTAPFIKAAGGEKAATDLNKWLSDFETGGVADAQGSALLKRWLNANTANALFGKMGVLAKQIPAAYGSAAEVGWLDWIKSARRVLRGEAATTRTEAAQSRIMQGRAFTRPDAFTQAARARGATPFTGFVRRVTGGAVDLNAIDIALLEIGGAIGRVDAFFTGFSAAVAYDARFREAKESGDSDDAAHAYAERETERVISRTAQPDTLANKSLFENRLSDVGRLYFAFQSANRQALFMTFAAFRNDGMKSPDAWRKAVTHWAVTGLVTQTVGNVIRDILSDDDKDEIWEVEDYMRAMTFGPFTAMLNIGPVIDAAASALGGFERRQGMGPGAAVTSAGKAFYDAMKEGESFDWRRNEIIARGLGSALGGRFAALNVSANMLKQLVGAVDNLSESPEETAEREKKARAKAKKEAKDAAQ